MPGFERLKNSTVDQSMGPAFIDFHDAVISSVKLGGDFSAIISFESLNCFYAIGANEYEVWACAADIACYAVQAFKSNGKAGIKCQRVARLDARRPTARGSHPLCG
jgi:hypothetical protein